MKEMERTHWIKKYSMEWFWQGDVYINYGNIHNGTLANSGNNDSYNGCVVDGITAS